MTRPRDGFERYLTEKLWEWIPEVHRHEDGLAPTPGVLRALIEIIGEHAAVARRSVDRLWEDAFVETADDWAVPYIADLVGTRLVNSLNRRGRRVDVARTIFARRRKGTLPVLEMLVRDIAGWDGVAVEAFRRLGRAPHRLDPPPQTRAGIVSATPPGGTADLRRVRGGDIVDGPWEDYARSADVRRSRGHLGRFNISKINVHLYRQRAFRLVFVTPFAFGDDRYGADPSGRDVPLFRPSVIDADPCTLAVEWSVAAPLDCRLLGEARYRLAASDLPAAIAAALRPVVDVLYRDEARLREVLGRLLSPADVEASIADLLARAIRPDSPRVNLIPNALAVIVGPDGSIPPVTPTALVPANLADWGATLDLPPDKRVAVDPERGRILVLSPPPGPPPPPESRRLYVPVHHVGLFGPLGAGTYDRRESVATTDVADLPTGPTTAGGEPADPAPVVGLVIPSDGRHQLVDSRSYEVSTPAAATTADVRNLLVQAENGERPHLRFTPDAGDAWTFVAAPKPAGGDPADPANLRTLVLDGLWLGIVPRTLGGEPVASAETPAPLRHARLVVDGELDRVVIRNCTVDPGGERARVDPLVAFAIPAVTIELVGAVEELVIERSIVGPLVENATAVDPCSAARIVVRDSVVHALDPARAAIATKVAAVVLERTTVFGDVRVNRLDATEALIQGRVVVTDNQRGCFRFSAAHDGPDVRLPPQFESTLFAGGIPNHAFVSRRFGEPGYAELSATAPDALARGAENGSEIGVWQRLLTPIKRIDLEAKIAEFLPFGLIAQLVVET